MNGVNLEQQFLFVCSCERFKNIFLAEQEEGCWAAEWLTKTVPWVRFQTPQLSWHTLVWSHPVANGMIVFSDVTGTREGATPPQESSPREVPPTGWAALGLAYKVQWPLHILFTPAVLEKWVLYSRQRLPPKWSLIPYIVHYFWPGSNVIAAGPVTVENFSLVLQCS